MSALIWKELRENTRWLPIGSVVVAVICYLVLPGRYDHQTLVARDLVTQLAIVLPLLAFALGIVQAFRDLQPAGRAYLNHRSVTSREILLAKTAVGFLLYATAVVIPVLILAGWIGIQGMDRHPMRPAQVIPALVFAVASFVMHPAAMLMLVRGASWWGTRILPLIPAAAVIVPFFLVLRNGGLKGAGYGLIAAVAVLVWMIAIARQGWSDFANDPPASRANAPQPRVWLLPTYLFVGIVSVFLAVIAFGFSVIEQWNRSTFHVPVPYSDLAVDSATGKLWMMTFIQEYDPKTGTNLTKPIGGDEVENGKSVNPFQDIDAMEDPRRFVPLRQQNETYGGSDGFFTSPISLTDSSKRYSYDERGYLICYTAYPEIRWRHTIAADGVHPAGQLAGRPFVGYPIPANWSEFSLFYEAGYNPPLIDSNGVYLLGQSPARIKTLIDQPIDSLAVIANEQGHAPNLLVRSDNQLMEYQLIDASGSDQWFQLPRTDQPTNRANGRSLYDLPIAAKRIEAFGLPAELSSHDYLRVAESPNGWYITTAATVTPAYVYHFHSEGELDRIAFTVEPGASTPSRQQDRLRAEPILAGLLPGAVVVAGVVVATWISLTQSVEQPLSEWFVTRPIQAATFSIAFVLICLLSFWSTVRVARQRGLSHGQKRAWFWSVLMLGLAAPLAMIAIYREVQREPCPQCQKPRRVDEVRCEHCGTQWEPLQSEGIEITDRQQLPQSQPTASPA